MRKTLVASLMAVVIVALSSLGVSEVHAAPTAASSSPEVVVVRDVTLSSHCRQGYIANVGKATQTASSASCLAGTVVGTFHVPLSEALQNREAYVMLPAANAPQAVLNDAFIAIQNLIASVHDQAIRRRMSPTYASDAVTPNTTGCGQGGFLYSSWTPNYDQNVNMQGKTNFYKKVDCVHVIFDQSAIGQYYGSDRNYWSHNRYGSQVWQLYCRYIVESSGNYDTFTPDTTQYDAGGAFEMETSNDYLGGGCNPFASYDEVEIGIAN